MFLRIQAIQLAVLISVLVHAAVLVDIGRHYTAWGKRRDIPVVTFHAVITNPSPRTFTPPSPAAQKTESEPSKPSAPPKPPVSRHRPRPVRIAKASAVSKAKPDRRSPVSPPAVSRPTKDATLSAARPPMVTMIRRQENYTRQILRRIEQHKRYPPAARRRRLTGSVTLSLRIAADGHIESLRCHTGNAVLCRAAQRATRSAAPFPPPPDGIGHLAFEYRMRFRLY